MVEQEELVLEIAPEPQRIEHRLGGGDEGAAEALQAVPLVRGVLVDDKDAHRAVPRRKLREDKATVELPDDLHLGKV